MGRRLVQLQDIRYRETAAEIAPERIVYDDLVRSLRADPTKYFPPTVDDQYVLTKNSVFVRAARDAGLQELLVVGPWPENETPLRPEGEITRNLVFFHRPDFRDVESIVRGYAQECAQALAFPSPQNIHAHRYGIKGDCLDYALLGQLESPEDISLITAPTIHFLRKLHAEVGRIRSVNGIIPHL